jgi:signal transduction histidine kinase
MRRARHGHLIRNFPTRYIHKNGSITTLTWSGVWSEPEQRHFFIGRDVTEQKRVERMKDEFIATVSHELRTPVTSIAGSLGLLNAAVDDLPDSAKALVAIGHANTKRLVQLINDILDIENIESGKMVFDFHRVDLRPLVERSIEINQPFAEKFNAEVRLDFRASDYAVRTDADRLTQVIVNLLSNAIKFSPPGEEVVVSIVPRRDHLRIAVRDHGPGIPDDFKRHMFEKFAQADATNTRQRGGTGLGLSIVKQTMIRLGGDVGCDAAPSGGTIFHVDVPRWNAKSMAEWDSEPSNKFAQLPASTLFKQRR